MSRIGKKPITVPSGVEVKVDGQKVTVKGAKGEMSHTLPECLTVAVEGTTVTVTPQDEERSTRALWGLNRTLVSNMIEGTSKGFAKKLEIKGVGYRCNIVGKTLKLELGYSHDINMAIPEGIEVKQDEKNKNLIEISGYNKQVVGQFCAEIRKWRPPEPYKGKGIKYEGEIIRRKVGKAAGA